jgi:ADP-ribose pyrophosphatase YjhB (NUDIX family)
MHEVETEHRHRRVEPDRYSGRVDPPRQAPVLAVGAVVLDAGGRVLLVQRGRPPMAGAWTLPGGRVRPEESLEAAVLREILEETALAARVVCALGAVTIEREGSAYVIHEHLLVPETDPAGPLFPGDDAAAARWFPRPELPAFGVLPDALAVVDLGFAEARSRSLLRPGS